MNLKGRYELVFVDSYGNFVCKQAKPQSSLIKNKTKTNLKERRNMGGTTNLLPLIWSKISNPQNLIDVTIIYFI
jgi:hypothetical protein